MDGIERIAKIVLTVYFFLLILVISSPFISPLTEGQRKQVINSTPNLNELNY